MFNHSRYDALVVGARCAGAATAMLMAAASRSWPSIVAATARIPHRLTH